MRIKTKQAVVGYLFALPSLAGFCIFYLFPSIISFFYCFTIGIGNTRFVGFKNFQDLLQNKAFLLAVKNTLIFNGISIPLIVILSLAFALLLNDEVKGLSFIRSFFILPLVIPVASVILVWNIFFDQYGTLNQWLLFLKSTPVDWMNTKWSVGVLVLLFIWKNCGYNVVLFLSGLSSIPKMYYEAAQIDGAGRFTCFVKITIPYLIPTGFFVFVVSIINSFKVFREAYLLAGSYPNLNIYMLQHFMNNNFYNLSYQRLTTAAFLMAVVITVLVLALFRLDTGFGRRLR